MVVKRLFERLTPEDRILQSKAIIKELTYRIQFILQLHAANEIVNYSSKLSSQIDPSPAAAAFTILQDSLFQHEVIKLLAIWDKAEENAVSIPTVLKLLDHPEVIDKIYWEVLSHHIDRGFRLLNPSNDPAIQEAINASLRESQKAFALEQADKARMAIKACMDAVSLLADGELAEGLLNLRDRVAHSVTYTRRELRGKNARAKYGHEREILERTISIIEDLYCWVNGTSFDIASDCFESARNDASDFWGNLIFQRA